MEVGDGGGVARVSDGGGDEVRCMRLGGGGGYEGEVCEGG